MPILNNDPEAFTIAIFLLAILMNSSLDICFPFEGLG